MRSLFKKNKQTLYLFAGITVIAYGLMLPFTGFYWDDWPFAWIAKFLGPADFFPAFAPFRPFLGPIFYLTTSLIPPVPIYWQIFALVIRLILGLSTWWAFKQIWPNRPQTTLIASLFILVFPGYSQHWVALTHINQELIPFIFYLLSFGFTFKAINEQKKSCLIAALVFQVLGIFPTEYFFGIEGIRALFIFFHFQGNIKERSINALKIWWPYLLVWIFNAAWLYYYYKFGAYNSYEVTAAQSPNLLFILTEALDAVWKAGIYVWTQVIVLTFSSLPAPGSILTLGLVTVSAAFLIPYLLRTAQVISDNERSFPVSLIIIGLFGILLGRLPSLAAGLPLTLQSSFDRFMISMMIGGSLFTIGLLELIIKNQRTRLIIFAMLISLGIGQQFFNANIFRRDWSKQADIYWQMAWRIPGLEPNTVLLTYEMPIDYETDASFTAPINWIYAPEFTRSNLPYMLLNTEKRIGGGALPSLEPGTEVFYPYRTVDFRSTTSNAVVIYMPRSGCLRVLDPARGDGDIYAKYQDAPIDAIPLSDPSRIKVDQQTPVLPAFIPEPKHDWCYYYTKAGLALQKNDYSLVKQLGNEAVSKGFLPQDQNEWLVFIEANAMIGKLDTAEKLSIDALGEDPRVRRGVCTVWKRLKANGPEGNGEAIRAIYVHLNCNP